MKTQISPARALLLALAPALGLLVLAWQGAHRPERLIVGKWRLLGLDRTLEFRPNGTYISLMNEVMETRLGNYKRSRSLV